MPSYAEYYGIVLPAESDVASGVDYGWAGTEFTGTLTGSGGIYTSAANVRFGTDRGDGVTGTLRVPTASQVLSGVLVDATTGNVVLPAVGDVQSGVTFGASSGSTGTLVLPTQSQVQVGVGFGASGTEFTGTLTGGGSESIIVSGSPSRVALRGTTDLTPIQFTFPTPSITNSGFTTKTKRIDGGSSANITGAISFLYSINGEHYYQIAYNSADRPSAAGVVTYLISDGTSTVSFDLQVIAIASEGSTGIAVLPGRDRAVADAGASTITVKLGEIITIARGVVDANGQPMDLSGFTNLQFVVQDARGVDLATVNHADITISGANDDTYSFVTPSAMTAKLGVFDFSLNQVGGAQIVGGKWIVLRRAVAD